MSEQPSKEAGEREPESTRRSWLKIATSKFYKVLVDLGPIATLAAILLTNYHSFRAYQLSKESTRAWLYPGDVSLLPGEPTQLQMFFNNAGIMPAQILQRGGEILLPQDPSYRVHEYEGSTHPASGIVEKGKSIGFVNTLGTLVGGPDHTPVRSMDQLLNTIRAAKQSIYFHGRLQYFDGIETRWLPYCKVLTADFGWQDCSFLSSP